MGDPDRTERLIAQLRAERNGLSRELAAHRDACRRRLRRNARISVAVVAAVIVYSITIYSSGVEGRTEDELLECLNTYMPRGDATSTEISDAFGVCFDGDEPPPEPEPGPPPQRPDP